MNDETTKKNQSDKKSKPRKLGKHFELLDVETGEILKQSTTLDRSDNGKDWNIMYQLTLYHLATDKTYTATDLRTYMFILANLDYKCKFLTSKSDMAEKMDISYPKLLSSLKKLKKNDLIRESRISGVTAFFANPEYVTRGSKKGELLKAYEKIPAEVKERLSVQAAEEKLLNTF